MANNTLLASDNFVSGSLAAGWSAIPTLSVGQVTGTPKVVEPNNTVNPAGQIWTGLVWPNDHASELTVAALTAEAGTQINLTVRSQSGTYSGYEANLLNGTAIISRRDSGVFTSLTSVSVSIAAGDVWTFQACGGLLTLYQNGNRILYVADTTYTSGSPGFYQASSVNITHTQVGSWRGYNAIQQDGIWQKKGIVFNGVSGSFPIGPVDNSVVLHEGNAQILSGTVYKTWFSDGPQSGSAKIWYAESLDGVNWTRSASAVINGYLTPAVIKNGSTYNLYAQPGASAGTGTFALFTSSDGVNWTLISSTVLGLGTAGLWDSSHLWSFAPVAIIAGTWYALYSAGMNGAAYYNSVGLATSPDGVTWTKYVSNPVLQNAYAGQAFTKVGSTWYWWFGTCQLGRGGALPTLDPNECTRYQTTNFINWTNPVKSIHCSQLFEGVNSNVGQSYFNSFIDINGKAYGYTTSSENDSTSPVLYQIGLAVAPVPIASVILQNEDAAQQTNVDLFTSGLGDLSANWTTPTGGTKFQIVSGNLVQASALAVTCNMCYTGGTFSANQYSEITLATLSDNLVFSTPAVRMATNTQNFYQVDIQGPTGTASPSCQIFRTVAGANTSVGPAVQITPQVGDVYRLSVINGSDGFPVLSFFQNGYLILQVQDYSTSALTTGFPGMAAYVGGGSNLTHAQISLWAGGNAGVIPAYPANPANVYSVPDCRVAPFGPNASRTVNATVTYDVQTSSNPAIPPKDCRVAGAPVDCRLAANIPQNSRTPGTYGPGE